METESLNKDVKEREREREREGGNMRTCERESKNWEGWHGYTWVQRL